MTTSILAPIGTQYYQIVNLIFGYPQKPKPKEKIYVIGNGWASYYFVKNLNKHMYEPIIIAPNKKVLNTPKLVNYLLDSNEVVEFPNPYAKIIPDMLEDINLDKKILITKSGSSYPYSKVVLAIGSEPNDFGIPGVESHTYKFKTIQDANLLRDRLYSSTINNQIYVVGSGITGIELASKIGKVFNVKVIEGFGTILPGHDDLTKNIIRQHLEQTQRYIDIQTNTMVKSIGDNSIDLMINNNKIVLNFDNKKDLIVWTGGVRFNGFGKTKLFNTLNTITPIKPRGLDVGEDFSLKPNFPIYCIGDMVANAGPPSAQNARIQGEWLAMYFNSGFDNKYFQTNKFESTSKGKLVHLVNDIYLESEYYSGFIPGIIDNIIEWINK